MARPQMNVLLIIVDQWRGDTLGALGHPCVRTPNIDRLAAEGVSFTRHYAQSSPCGPSRASMLTGQYLMNHRVITNDTPTAAHRKTMSRFMREAGYEPALIGYTTTVPDPRVAHSNDPRFTTNTIAEGWNIVRDFEGEREHYMAYLAGLGYDIPKKYVDIFRPPKGTDESLRLAPSPIKKEHSETAWSIDAALDYIRIRQDEPWCLHLGTYRPHPPFMAPKPYDAMYDPAAMPAPLRAPELASEKRVHPLTHLLLEHVKASNAVRHWPGLASAIDLEGIAKIRAAYYALCTEVDDHLGRVFDLLRATGQDERTLVILTSDHGEQLGDHYMVSKRGYFPQSYHIPCIVRDPTSGGERHAWPQVRCLHRERRCPADDPRLAGRALAASVRRSYAACRSCRGEVPGRWRKAARYEYDFRDMASRQGCCRARHRSRRDVACLRARRRLRLRSLRRPAAAALRFEGRSALAQQCGRRSALSAGGIEVRASRCSIGGSRMPTER
jgi:arylsulfatase A-like enzyme